MTAPTPSTEIAAHRTGGPIAEATQPNTVTLAQCVELLEARRLIVCNEINACARPTAACDVDFNTLLAERAEIALALAHLQPLCAGQARIAHPRDDQ